MNKTVCRYVLSNCFLLHFSFQWNSNSPHFIAFPSDNCIRNHVNPKWNYKEVGEKYFAWRFDTECKVYLMHQIGCLHAIQAGYIPDIAMDANVADHMVGMSSNTRRCWLHQYCGTDCRQYIQRKENIVWSWRSSEMY